MRCLSLAEKLRQRGHIVEFAARDLAYNINNAIEKKQFKLHTLLAPSHSIHLNPSKNEDSWLEIPLEDEISEFGALVNHVKPDWVIVDHYALGQKWEEVVLKSGVRLFVIDDLFRPHSCDVFLDQNYYRDHSKFLISKLPENCHKFLGPQFALLNDEILDLKGTEFRPVVKNILAFFGGSDPANASEKFIQSWTLLDQNEIQGTLIVGESNPLRNSLKNRKVTHLKILESGPEFYKLLANTDLYIGAGGSTSWERCFFGVPGLTIAVAKNQVSIAENLAAINCHEYLGLAENITSDLLAEKIKMIIKDSKRRELFSSESLNIRVSSRLSELISFFDTV